MKITMTVRELVDKGLWLRYCRLKGWSEWLLNESRISDDEELVITEDELKELEVSK